MVSNRNCKQNGCTFCKSRAAISAAIRSFRVRLGRTEACWTIVKGDRPNSGMNCTQVNRYGGLEFHAKEGRRESFSILSTESWTAFANYSSSSTTLSSSHTAPHFPTACTVLEITRKVSYNIMSYVFISSENSSLKLPKMVHFGEFLKTWSIRSVTWQVSFNGTKILGKY